MHNKPVFLVDLDDTLFQTKRKMTDELGQIPYQTGAMDRSGNARSFMTQEQAMFVDWLLASAHLIPVTARGTEEISRVTIPFHSWAITTHGAVILTPEGEPDKAWHQHILTELTPYQDPIKMRQEALTHAFKAANIQAWARINEEYDGTSVYLVAKHTDSTKLDELYRIADQIDHELGLDGFYVHRNGNNVAWLPQCIEKGLATQYLIQKLRAQLGPVPVIGLGDSLSDHTFLRHCTWFGMPKQSQLASYLTHSFGE